MPNYTEVCGRRENKKVATSDHSDDSNSSEVPEFEVVSPEGKKNWQQNQPVDRAELGSAISESIDQYEQLAADVDKMHRNFHECMKVQKQKLELLH